MFIFMFVYDTVFNISQNFQLIPKNSHKFLVSFKPGIFQSSPDEISMESFRKCFVNLPEIFRLFATLVVMRHIHAQW